MDRLATVLRRYAALKVRWDDCQVELEDWYERPRECPDHGDPVLRAYAAVVRVVRTQEAS